MYVWPIIMKAPNGFLMTQIIKNDGVTVKDVTNYAGLWLCCFEFDEVSLEFPCLSADLFVHFNFFNLL